MEQNSDETRRATRHRWAFASMMLVLCGGAYMMACSAASSAKHDESGSGSGDFGDGDAASGDGDINFGSGGSSDSGGIGFGGDGNGIPVLPPLPEEVEDDSSYRAPLATGRYLWSANPQSGRVALIDVIDLETEVLPAGLFPTFLTSIGTDDEPAALVLNVGSSDATRFRVLDDEILIDSVDTHAGANRWSRSASGNWAVAWSRPEPGQVLDPTEGLQELTIIELSDDGMKSTRLVGGYRPSQVLISSDEERLIVVSEEGIDLIALGSEPEKYDWINLGFDAERRDVSVDADGTFALVRRTDESVVELVDLLQPESRSDLSFSGVVTDLDLSESGRAVAVIRERSEVATFTLQDVISDASAIDTLNIPGEVFGSAVLTQDGRTAVLYTNVLINPKVNIVNLSEASFLEHRAFDTESPVYSVVPTPDGEHAVVLAGADELVLGDQAVPAQAFSVIALRSERFPRVVGTDAPVRDVALGNDFGLVTATSESGTTHEAHLIEFPGLNVKEHRLSTRPLAAGVIPDLNTAYAAQLHPEGRVTFFDFETDHARTLTGFELAAGVVDE